jgi:hypothetical protein
MLNAYLFLDGSIESSTPHQQPQGKRYQQDSAGSIVCFTLRKIPRQCSSVLDRFALQERIERT